MSEHYIAVVTLSLMYILLSPVVIMMIFDIGGQNFRKDYAAAFIGWHLIGLFFAGIAALITAFWWAIDVVLV
jgi:hypothetical protein